MPSGSHGGANYTLRRFETNKLCINNKTADLQHLNKLWIKFTRPIKPNTSPNICRPSLLLQAPNFRTASPRLRSQGKERSLTRNFCNYNCIVLRRRE